MAAASSSGPTRLSHPVTTLLSRIRGLVRDGNDWIRLLAIRSEILREAAQTDRALHGIPAIYPPEAIERFVDAALRPWELQPSRYDPETRRRRFPFGASTIRTGGALAGTRAHNDLADFVSLVWNPSAVTGRCVSETAWVIINVLLRMKIVPLASEVVVMHRNPSGAVFAARLDLIGHDVEHDIRVIGEIKTGRDGEEYGPSVRGDDPSDQDFRPMLSQCPFHHDLLQLGMQGTIANPTGTLSVELLLLRALATRKSFRVYKPPAQWLTRLRDQTRGTVLKPVLVLEEDRIVARVDRFPTRTAQADKTVQDLLSTLGITLDNDVLFIDNRSEQTGANAIMKLPQNWRLANRDLIFRHSEITRSTGMKERHYLLFNFFLRIERAGWADLHQAGGRLPSSDVKNVK